ncbi:MAG TPA: DNA-3-methyladenine glycosylase I [Chthoniobacterales bacterium]
MSDDHRLFEKLSLEGFQSGLSWRTILAKGQGSNVGGCCHVGGTIRPVPESALCWRHHPTCT